MKVKTLRTIAGPWGTFAAGEIADLPEKIAHSLILGRGAEAVEDAPPEVKAEAAPEPVYETAAAEAPEAAEFPPRRRRKA